MGSLPRPHTSCGFFWQETHWGEALRVLQMWKVLLPEGESPGARSPELYEPLGTGTCVLAQVPVGRGTLACLPAIREGPPGDRLRRDGRLRRATASLAATELVLWYYRWGHRSQERKGGILSLPSRPQGFGEGSSRWGMAAGKGKGHLATPPTPLAGPCGEASQTPPLPF